MSNENKALNKFIKELAEEEAGKSSANVGDIRQLVKIINKKTGGKLYEFISDSYAEQGGDPAFDGGEELNEEGTADGHSAE